VHFALIDAVTLVGYTGSTVPGAIADASVVFAAVLSQNAGNPNGAYDFTLLKPLDDLPASVTDIKLSFDFTAKDGDGDTTPGQFTVTVRDDAPSIGTSSVGNVSEDGPLGLTAAPLAINWGADSSNVTGADRALAFSNSTVSVVDPAGHAVSLTSYGQAVHVGFIGAVLVGYTGSAPLTVNDANVVFTASLSDVTGSYNFTLKQPLDHAAPVGSSDHLDLGFNITATDADGDTATGTFTVRVDAAGTIGSIDYTNETTGVFVNLGDAAATIGTQIVSGHSATDLATGGGHVIGIDALGTITDASGGSADDVIVGGSGAGTIHGNGGNDTIVYNTASGGTETVDGGTGTDTEIVNGSSSAVTYNVNAITVGTDTDIGINIVAGVTSTSTVAATDGSYEVATKAVEEIQINLGSAGDHVVVSGDLSGTVLATSTITIKGGAGDDTVDVSGRTSDHRCGRRRRRRTDTAVLGTATRGIASTAASFTWIENANGDVGVRVTHAATGGPGQRRVHQFRKTLLQRPRPEPGRGKAFGAVLLGHQHRRQRSRPEYARRRRHSACHSVAQRRFRQPCRRGWRLYRLQRQSVLHGGYRRRQLRTVQGRRQRQRIAGQ